MAAIDAAMRQKEVTRGDLSPIFGLSHRFRNESLWSNRAAETTRGGRWGLSQTQQRKLKRSPGASYFPKRGRRERGRMAPI